MAASSVNPPLTRGDVIRVANKYIGVSGGYLGDFSYRTHEEFYLEFCNLDIDPNSIQGTTRERFIAILSSASTTNQAKILRGVLDKYPIGSNERRTEKSAADIQRLISRLEGQAIDVELTVTSTRAALKTAMDDARSMIQQGRPENAVDRIHTAFHDHLKAIWDELQWKYDPRDGPGKLFRNLVKYHPSFLNKVVSGQDIQKILRSMSAIIDGLNPIRNNASLAHPSESLLDEPEAFLYVNTVRTLMQYMDQKLGHS